MTKSQYRIREHTGRVLYERGNHWFVVLGPGSGLFRFEVFTYSRESAELIMAKAIAGQDIVSADYF